jgi:hypothetical protein
LDAYLATRSLHFDAVIVGGAALVLLGVVTRTTDDRDVLDPEIPSAILDTARAFAAESGIGSEWLNSRAHDFVRVVGCLPDGSRTRLRPVYRGPALHIDTLGAFDLLCTKLVALIDRGTDFEDCVARAPTLTDLQAAWPFIEQYEGNLESREQFWLPLARRQLNRLAVELGLDAVF